MPRHDSEEQPAGDALDVPERRARDIGPGSPEVAAEIPDPEWMQQSSVGAVLVAMERTTGPLPSKDWLEAAETHYPGVTQALVDDYISERTHARELLRQAAVFDETSFHRFAEYQRSQLAAATAIVLVIALGGVVLALDGKSLYGFGLLVFEVAGLVLAFLYGRTRSDDRPPTRGDDS
jgi:hypothetical protein